MLAQYIGDYFWLLIRFRYASPTSKAAITINNNIMPNIFCCEDPTIPISPKARQRTYIIITA